MWAMLGKRLEEETLRNDQRTTLQCRSDHERQQQQPDKKRKLAAVSSDEKQLASGKKRPRLMKAAVKEEEKSPPVKKEEEIEDDLHQHKDEDSMKPSAVVKIEEVDKTEVKEDSEDEFKRDRDEAEDCETYQAAVKEEKEDLEETIGLVEDEARHVAEEMEVQMHAMRQQYETVIENLRARLLESSGVVSTSQMQQNKRMRVKLGTSQEQVDEYEAEIKRMQEDHEESLGREKERGDQLEKELQRLQQLYPEIEENDPTEVDGDEESSEEQIEKHPEQESHELSETHVVSRAIRDLRERLQEESQEVRAPVPLEAAAAPIPNRAEGEAVDPVILPPEEVSRARRNEAVMETVRRQEHLIAPAAQLLVTNGSKKTRYRCLRCGKAKSGLLHDGGVSSTLQSYCNVPRNQYQKGWVIAPGYGVNDQRKKGNLRSFKREWKRRKESQTLVDEEHFDNWS
jgi:hypothetical protein